MSVSKTDRRVEIRDLIRSKGLRATSSRVGVYELLSQVSAPISHGDVADKLAHQGWDRATLYRNLIDLTQVGLVRRTDVGDHLWRFELNSGVRHEETHPHFTCNTCGDVICLEDAKIKVSASREAPRAVKRQRFEVQLKGLCDRCVAA